MEDETGRWIIDLVSFKEGTLEEFRLDIFSNSEEGKAGLDISSLRFQ